MRVLIDAYSCSRMRASKLENKSIYKQIFHLRQKRNK